MRADHQLRRFGRNALDVALDIDVEHQIADDRNARVFEPIQIVRHPSRHPKAPIACGASLTLRRPYPGLTGGAEGKFIGGGLKMFETAAPIRTI